MRRRNTNLARAVSAFYAALARKRPRARPRPRKRVLVATIDVTGFTPDELTRGAIQHAAMPRDRHYPARSVAFTVATKET